MPKKRKRGRGNRGSGGNAMYWKVRACWGVLGALRIMPPPKLGSMSEGQYAQLLSRLVTRQLQSQMGRLGQILVDPEFPDTYDSFLGLILLPACGTATEYITAMETLRLAQESAGASGSSGGTSGSSSSPNADTLAGSSQSWTQNTADWFSQTLGGNWSGGLNSFAEGWNSFWTGNF